MQLWKMRPNEPHNHNAFMIVNLVKSEIVDFLVEYLQVSVIEGINSSSV